VLGIRQARLRNSHPSREYILRAFGFMTAFTRRQLAQVAKSDHNTADCDAIANQSCLPSWRSDTASLTKRSDAVGEIPSCPHRQAASPLRSASPC
jgi:hypothetical protein